MATETQENGNQEFKSDTIEVDKNGTSTAETIVVNRVTPLPDVPANPRMTTAVHPPELVENQLPVEMIASANELDKEETQTLKQIEKVQIKKDEKSGTGLDENPLGVLGDDIGSQIEPEEIFIRTQLKRYFRKIQKANTKHKLRQLKLEAISFAQLKKAESHWDQQTDGILLQELLRAAYLKENQLNTSNAPDEALEAPELSKMLRNDRYQHTCDVKGCLRTSLGWLCVFFFCQVPWIIVVFIIGVGYRQSIIAAPIDPNNDSGPDTNTTGLTSASCYGVSTYLFGFFIIYCVNIIFGLVYAISRTIDDSRNACTKTSPYVMSFIGVSIIGYNVYGIVVVWNYDLWYTPVTTECANIRGLAIAVIAFFFLLPISCFTLYQLFGNREKRDREGGGEFRSSTYDRSVSAPAIAATTELLKPAPTTLAKPTTAELSPV
jgi:hypothetical protein